jgi:hypothetical protein
LPGRAFQVLLVDARTLFDGCDEHDRVHIAMGGEFVTEPMSRRYWKGEPISGAFSPRNLAAEMRQRVHFLGFVSEKDYVGGEFAQVLHFIANPHLLADTNAAREAFSTWPVRRAEC